MATHVYSMAINYNSGGQFASNVLHYQFDDAGYLTTATAAHALLTAWDTANRTPLLNALPNAVTLLSYRGRRITGGGGFEAQLVMAPGVVGARASPLQAAGISPMILFYPTGNLKQRGKMFLPGISEADAVDGQIQPAHVTRMTTLAGAILAPITLAGGGAPVAAAVLWSRKLLAAVTLSQAQISKLLCQIGRRELPV